MNRICLACCVLVAGAPLGQATEERPTELRALRQGSIVPDLERDTLSFVVLGHVRGDDSFRLHYLLDELLAEVQSLDADFVVLTGDMIWGDVHADSVPDLQTVVAEWDRLDGALSALGVPVFRVPGNHDISDALTRDLFFERYGPIPRSVDIGRVRLLLLSSTWIPKTGDPRRNQSIRGVPIDSVQLRFLRDALADRTAYDHAFVFMAQLLWWGPDDSRWWREVHPLLVERNVRAVFTGEYGPLKFSHLRRDGIDYYQSGVAPTPPIEILHHGESHRILAQQFDNFLRVTVRRDSTDIEVHTVGEVSSGHFTPQRYRAIYDERPSPEGVDVIRALLTELRQRPKLLALLIFAFVGGIFLGLLAGRQHGGHS